MKRIGWSHGGAPRWLMRVLVTCACSASAAAMAQDDPLLGASADDAVSAPAWDWFGDLLLRGDSVRHLANRDDVERVRSRGRIGLRWSNDTLEFGVAAEAALASGSDPNSDNRRNNDNERSDDLNLDQFYLRWQAGESTALALGKTTLPLALTPLTWDSDLRPVGASVEHSFALDELSRLSFVAGYFAGDHLYGDDSRIGAAQVGWHIHEGAETSGDVLLAFLDFDDLQNLVDQGLARTNRRVAGRLVNDYRLADLQLGLRHMLGTWPLDARLDLVHNFGADTQRDGARFSVVLGTSEVPRGWEFGYAVQRIQREAVMASFNADDWWFHSFARGSMPWVAYGIDETWSVRVAGFFERRDDQPDTVDRVLLDLRARW